jgi:mono/diheme cytochrome c family protein
MTRRFASALVAAALICGAGCENGMKNMYEQPKYTPLAASPLWADGRASRPLETDTVVHSAGAIAGASSGRRDLSGPEPVHAQYAPAALQRGRNRYDIYCAPCHGLTGDGAGYVALRGFPHPPSYDSERLRAVSDAYVFGVITHGYGAMYAYDERIPPRDRWAIVAYVRALQLAARSPIADIASDQRSRLESLQ